MGLVEGRRLMWWVIWRGGGRVVGLRKMEVNREMMAWIAGMGWGSSGGSGCGLECTERWNKVEVELVWIIHRSCLGDEGNGPLTTLA